MKNFSEQERDNGHAQGWVVTELLQVAAMLALGPDSHLGEAHQGEEGHCGQNKVIRMGMPSRKGRALHGYKGLTWNTLRHDGKANPRPHLWTAQAG